MTDGVTGLNLETFLWLLRADLAAWGTLALIAFLLALMTWTSWGSRRVLRKCLALSIVAHCVLVVYGGTIPIVRMALGTKDARSPRERLRQVRVSRPAPLNGSDPAGSDARSASGVGRSQAFAAWDRPESGFSMPDAKLAMPESDRLRFQIPAIRPGQRVALAPPIAEPDTETPAPPEPKVSDEPQVAAAPAPPAQVSPATGDEVPAVVVTPLERSDPGLGPAARSDARLRSRGTAVDANPARDGDVASRRMPLPPAMTKSSSRAISGCVPSGPASSSVATADPAATPPIGDPEAVANVTRMPVPAASRLAMPDANIRERSRPERTKDVESASVRRPLDTPPLQISRVTPGGGPVLAEIHGTTGGRPLADIPEVYRTRLDPNRSARAYRAGASPASEQAVERALDWLGRHQDADGRWDAATARYDDGSPAKGEDDITVQSPPGETCFGECLYWEADTALTGLALLAYLGAGYTHTDGKYAPYVAKGIEFLLSVQKPDGDLRGKSKAVGMYCHAMASIALCEAYALTGDERLRDPVERAIGFLVRARAADGMAWRYAPGDPTGDTSILGWVVMALKSAKEVGIAVPSDLQTGMLEWLDKVSEGENGGLARYRPIPADKVTPTMTAEAWVCRQFLGAGGPGPSSSEAAASLLENKTDRGTYNFYYWYYGTLAMYQHGGDAWNRWNARVRDEIVKRQHTTGHIAGSWDPDDSQYGTRGGRVYCTALATLSLEVYYRYLRLYDEPKIPPAPWHPLGAGRWEERIRKRRGRADGWDRYRHGSSLLPWRKSAPGDTLSSGAHALRADRRNKALCRNEPIWLRPDHVRLPADGRRRPFSQCRGSDSPAW